MQNGNDRPNIHVESYGEGEETVVLAHSFLMDHRHYEPQIEVLQKKYRVVAYDHRGHGGSDPVPSEFAMQDIVDDGIRVIEDTDAAPCHWVGLSTGGFVGMRIALQRPDLIASLVLMSTSAHSESFLKRAKYGGLTLALRAAGWRVVIRQALKILFGPSFVSDPANRATLAMWREYISNLDDDGMIRFGEAIWSRDDVAARFDEIDVPLLVVLGAEDLSFTEEEVRTMVDNAPDAELLLLPGAGHICTLTHPEEVTSALETFLRRATERRKAAS